MILEKNKYYSSLKLFKLFSFLAFFDIDTTCGITIIHLFINTYIGYGITKYLIWYQFCKCKMCFDAIFFSCPKYINARLIYNFILLKLSNPYFIKKKLENQFF